MPPATPNDSSPAARQRRVSAPVKSLPSVLAKEPPKAVRDKKDAKQDSSAPATLTKPPPPSQAQDGTMTQGKKVSRRSSKPFINWFQRKLGGTRTRRASDAAALRPPIPDFPPVDGVQNKLPQEKATTNGQAKKQDRRLTMPAPPLQQLPLPPALPRANSDDPSTNGAPRPLSSHSGMHNTISLNGDGDTIYTGTSITDGTSTHRSSLALESTWSPSSAPHEADDDASVRPIPPSAPPSPSPSHAPSASSSSYLSDPRTFRSLAASTKPTTVLSMDLTGNGMAHIAQPVTPITTGPRLQHIRTPTAGSITFSVLPQVPHSASHPSSLRNVSTLNPSALEGEEIFDSQVQAPNHTMHHPRDNPRPSSPPPDDASVLTLASSAFGVPGARVGGSSMAWGGSVSNYITGTDSVSHFDAETNQYPEGDGDGDGEESEVGASVRALRPRRSWESEASRWSARVGGGSMHGPLTPSDVRVGLWSANSVKTGKFSEDWRNEGSSEMDHSAQSHSVEKPENEGDQLAYEQTNQLSPGETTDVEATPSMPLSPLPTEQRAETPKDDDYFRRTPLASPKSLGTRSRADSESGTESGRTPGQEADASSVAATDAQTDVWHSAPTTPAVWNE